MEKIIIENFHIYLTLLLLFNILFKIKPTALSCGLFGGVGDINLRSITSLGIANDSRGGDGTGYFYGGKIVKGISHFEKFEKLIADSPIEKIKGARLFLGHTRKATHGTRIEENTHPFNVEDYLILAHNGQIFNIDALCKKYDVDNTGISVDSHALALLLHKVGPKILNEYIGWAALAFTYTDQPDTLYLYHGASKEFNGTYSKVDTERPMFYLQTDRALYFSSLPESLVKIRESKKQKVTELPVNVVTKITNSKIIEKDAFIVDRELVNTKLYETRYPPRATTPSERYYSDFEDEFSTYDKMHNNYEVKRSPASNVNLQGKSNIIDINSETLPPEYRAAKNCIYFQKGRYYIKSAVIGSEARLAQGIIYACKTTNHFQHYAGNFGAKLPEHCIADFDGKPVTLYPYFFVRGVMIHNEKNYNKIMDLLRSTGVNSLLYKLNSNGNTALELSYYSKYPVCLHENENFTAIQGVDRKKWYFNGQLANFKDQKPQFASRKYNISKGYLTKFGLYDVGVSAPTLPFSVTWSDEVNKLAEEAHIPILSEFVLQGINDTLSVACDRYAKDYLTKHDPSFTRLSEVQKEALINEFVLSEIFFAAYKEKDSIAKQLGSAFPPIEFYINKVILEQQNDISTTLSVDTQGNLNSNIIDIPGDDDFHDEDTEQEELELEAEMSVEDLIETNYISQRADELQTIESSDFAQEIAKVLYDSSDSIKKNILNICTKYKKEEIIKTLTDKK